MKEDKKIIIPLIVAILLLLYNIFVFNFLKNLYVGCLFLTVLFGIIVFFKGFEKDKSEGTIDVTFNILSYVLCYFTFIYLLGIFTGYAKTIYNLSFVGILRNIVPAILIILAEEFLRYEVVTKVKKAKNEKWILGLLVLVFILFDSRVAFPLGEDIQTIMDNISLIIFPSIAKNMMLTYLIYLIGYKPVILYRILMELPIFLVPLYPNLGPYLTGVLDISFPLIVCLFIRKLVVKKRNFFVREKGHLISRIIGIFVGIFLIIVVSLTSGYFKYYALGVVSNSMYPGIARGDVVIVKKLNEEEKKEIEIGEILVYRTEDKVIVHRVIAKNENSGTYTYKTKGDNNENEDNITIYERDIIGVAQYRIPKIGYPSVWLSEWRVKE